MLDIQQFRNDLDGVVARLAARGFKLDAVAFSSLEAERKTIQTNTEALQAKRNAASKSIGMAKSKGEDVSAIMAEVAGIGDALKAGELRLSEIQEQLKNLMLNVPNIPHESVPQGKDEAGNVEVRKVGTPRDFKQEFGANFEIKDHTDVGTPLGLDFDTGAKAVWRSFYLNSVAKSPNCTVLWRSLCWIPKPNNTVTPNAIRLIW